MTNEPTTPTIWRYMTPEEKGALLLAHHENRTLQMWRKKTGAWEDLWARPLWADDCAYRVKLEPVRETVTLYYGSAGFHDYCAVTSTSKITFDIEDGKPDCNSVKMEEL